MLGVEERARIENPAVPLSSANIVAALGLGESTPAGVSVNQEKAMGITAFWAGVGAISRAKAGLPISVFEDMGSSRRRAKEHSAYRLLHVRPNPMMSPFTFKELTAAHILTWGNWYAEIEYNGAEEPIALWPLLPDRTDVEIRNGEKLYWTVINGSRVWLASRRVLHVPGLGFDGLKGYNVIKMHRDSLGLSIAANEYGAQFFGNSGRPSGFLKHPGKPLPDERLQCLQTFVLYGFGHLVFPHRSGRSRTGAVFKRIGAGKSHLFHQLQRTQLWSVLLWRHRMWQVQQRWCGQNHHRLPMCRLEMLLRILQAGQEKVRTGNTVR